MFHPRGVGAIRKTTKRAPALVLVAALLGARMLAGLDGHGVMGLALVPDRMR